MSSRADPSLNPTVKTSPSLTLCILPLSHCRTHGTAYDSFANTVSCCYSFSHRYLHMASNYIFDRVQLFLEFTLCRKSKRRKTTLSLTRLLTYFDAPYVRLRSWQGMACPTHVAYPSQMRKFRIFDVKSGRPESKPYSYNESLSNTFHFTIIPLQNPRHCLRLVREHRLLLLLLLP